MNVKKCLVISYESSRAKAGNALLRNTDKVIEVHDFDKGVVDVGLLIQSSLPLNEIICSKDHMLLCHIRQGRGYPDDSLDIPIFFESGPQSMFDTDILWLNGYRAVVGDSKFRWCLNMKTGNISSSAEHRNKFLYMHVFFASIRDDI